MENNLRPIFKVFTLTSNGPDKTKKICLDLSDIECVQQDGGYKRIPVEGDAPHYPDFDEDEDVNLLARPRRNPRQRTREVFVIDPNSFILQTKRGQTWHIEGSFDEICELLTRFPSYKESV
jgi:hypothetical protein